MSQPYRYAYFCRTKTLSGITAILMTIVTLVYMSSSSVNSSKDSMLSTKTLINTFWTNSGGTTKNLEPEIKDPLLRAASKIRAYSQTILVPIINDAYLPFAYNWLCNTQEMGLHENVLFITMDDKSSESLKRDWPAVSAVSMNVSHLSGAKQFGQAGYLKVNIKRHQHLYRLLKAGYEILHFDLDQFWPRNPLPYLQGQKGYDLLVTQVSGIKREYCSGFVYIFNTEKSVKVWELFVERLEEEGREIEKYKDVSRVPIHYMDQVPWSKIVQNKTRVPGLSVNELSLDEFADGPWYGKSTAQKNAINPYVIHNNFIVGNSAKKNRAQRYSHWFLYQNMTCNVDLVRKMVKNVY